MSTVPYTFANASGNIPLSQLDTNFANVKAFANTAGTVTTAAQPNITSVGTLSSLSVTGNIVGTLSTAAQPNITSVGTLTSLTVAGNITAGNIIGTIVGSISNAVYSNTAGTVTTAAQPNITSVGTLTSLAVTGNITSGNVSGTNIVGILSTAAQPNITSVGTLTSLAVAGNITSGNVSGTRGAFTNLSGTLETASQPNITSVGTLSSLSVTGNITSGNVSGTRGAFTNVSGALETPTVNLGTVSGSLQIDVSAGSEQNFTTSGNVTLSFANWPTTGTYKEINVTVTVANSAHKITGPIGIVNSYGIVGLNYATGVMSFPVSGVYKFTFSSQDAGSTISISENNTILRPYNSSSETITATSNATISIGTSYSIYNPSPSSSAGTAYLGNGVAGQIKTVGSFGLSTWAVTVASASWGNTITFNSAGQNVTLVWSEPFGAWLLLNRLGSPVLS